MLSDAFFVSPTVQARTVRLPDGTEHVLHFKQLAAVEFRKFHLAEQSPNDDVRAGNIARIVAASLCTEDGKPVMSYERALTLTPAAASALMEAVMAVNGYSDEASDATKKA